jgi:iron-sulfur cluster assembly accessory protein
MAFGPLHLPFALVTSKQSAKIGRRIVLTLRSTNLPIILTDRAVTELKDLMAGQEKSSSALRVWVAGGGCSGLQYGMALDDGQPEDGDQIFEQEGLKIFVDDLSLKYMEGASVDYVDDTLGGGFKIENPNAVSSCGCGSSFQTEEGQGGGCGSGCGCGSH